MLDPLSPNKKAIDSNEDVNYTKLLLKLDKFKQIIERSDFFSEITSIIPKSEKFLILRCLALGSPQESTPALYQLALVILLSNLLNIPQVSLYDPVFNNYDLKLFDSLNFTVSESFTSSLKSTFYFLPHAPLSLTNMIFTTNKPKYFLANHLQNHTDRYTKLQLFQKYPLIASLINLVHSKHTSNGFQEVKTRRNKKNTYKEPEIDYDYSNYYFKGLKIVSLTKNNGKNDPWGSSFSDLAYHEIEPVEDLEESRELEESRKLKDSRELEELIRLVGDLKASSQQIGNSKSSRLLNEGESQSRGEEERIKESNKLVKETKELNSEGN